MSWSSLWIVAAIAFGIFLLVAVGMAVGVLFGRRSISGSCGGLANRKDADGNTACSLCENPDEACRELREGRKDHPVAEQQDHGMAGTK